MTSSTSRFDPHRLPAKGVRSLTFRGDALVDWLDGGRVLGLDGSDSPGKPVASERFDGVAAAANQRFVALYERLGTHAVVIDTATGAVVRELQRGELGAERYVYPIALWVSADGDTLLAHCPDHHNRLEIDNLDTGKRLTVASDRKPVDYFYSRLSVSPSATRLLSAGWVSYPWDTVGWFDFDKALSEPTHLDKPQMADTALHVGVAEESSAAWVTDELLLIGSSEEPEDIEEVTISGSGLRLLSPGMALIDIRTRKVTSACPLFHPPGAMLPIGTHHAVTFYGYPRLYNLAGGLVHEWPQLPTGKLTGSIQHDVSPPPPMALDTEGRRFAVAVDDDVWVVRLG
jgi:hypothetical protein